MAEITLGGNPIHTSGELPANGSKTPDFLLTNTDLTDVSLKDFAGKKIVFNIFPSIDTSICAMSVRKFNAEISSIPGAICLCVSDDLPYAHKRFCTVEGLTNVIPLSELRNKDFGKNLGIRIMDGPMTGLLARAVVVADSNGKIIYNQLVKEIKTEPDYEKALNALKNAV